MSEHNHNAIHKAFTTLSEDLGPSYQISSAEAEKLGRLFYDYLVVSVYDMDWEGFTTTQLEGIKALLEDIVLFRDNQ